jgi:hypothetical protein
MTKKHIHTEFIHAFAKGEDIQYFNCTGFWVNVDPEKPIFYKNTKYRMKPKTINISGFEVQEHPHSELMHAWADGARIQALNTILNCWDDLISDPTWSQHAKYRIKPTAQEETNINDLRMHLCLSIEDQGIYPTMEDISLAIRRFEVSISDADPLKKRDIEWIGNVFDAFMCALDLDYSTTMDEDKQTALRQAIINLQSLIREDGNESE